MVILTEKSGSHVFEIVKDTSGSIWPFNYLVVKKAGEVATDTRKCRTEDDALAVLTEMMA